MGFNKCLHNCRTNGVWSRSWLLYVPQENGSRLEAAHLLLAPESSGEEAGHQVKSRQRPWFRRVGTDTGGSKKGRACVCAVYIASLALWCAGVCRKLSPQSLATVCFSVTDMVPFISESVVCSRTRLWGCPIPAEPPCSCSEQWRP